MPWPCLGRAAAQLILTCCPKSAYPIPQEAELCLYNSLLQIVIPCLLHPVIPAQAGTQLNPWRSWVPACAGMTIKGGGHDGQGAGMTGRARGMTEKRRGA